MSTIAKTKDYDAAFFTESVNEYRDVDAYEQRMGYTVDRKRLERAARVLACPVKANPPNWQHGRVIYSTLRNHLDTLDRNVPVTCIDVGTAKGFSAVVMAWALSDHGFVGQVISFDVIDPNAKVRRNSVVETLGTLRTVHEFVEQFLPLDPNVTVEFIGGSVGGCLPDTCFAFIDGKHTHAGAMHDRDAIAPMQKRGDILIFDDLQIPGIEDVFVSCKRYYELDRVWAKQSRGYGIARRR